MEANCALVIAASIQALATVFLVIVTARYVSKTNEMVKEMKESNEIQRKRQIIMADIVDIGTGFGMGITLEQIAQITKHSLDNIKWVLPELLHPGCIRASGHEKGATLYKLEV